MNIQSHFFKAVARLLIGLMCMHPVHSLAVYGDGGRAKERGYSSGQDQKRLGDGLYEQRLVREAIVARTGERFIAGLNSDEAMFRYLMDNAIASKEALNLSVGISLSAEQVAALTHDIVWMEEREVMGEKVLVPVLYMAQAEGRLAPNGALIQGQDLTLISGGDLSNQGTLRATNNLSAQAQNIQNSGLMQAGERLSLLAEDSLYNRQGGVLAGRDVDLTARTGDILNERSITRHESALGNSRWETSFADSAARIEAANSLNLSAGRDVLNLGGVLNSGGDMQISAGRDVSLSSVEERHSISRGSHYLDSQTAQLISETVAGGNLDIQAGRDLTAVASRIESGHNMQLVAGNDLTLASAANESHHYSKSKKRTSQRDLIQQQGTEVVSGGQFAAVAGNDLTLISSSIAANDEAYLVAGGKVQLLAEQDIDYSFSEKKKKGSFGRKSFKSDERTHVTHIGSSVSSGGDLAIISGDEQRYQAAQLSSGADLTLDSGAGIVFEGVKDLEQQSRIRSKNSWVWQSAKGKGHTDETLIQSQLQAQGELAIRAAERIQIDIKEVNQQSVSQTIDAMVQADPQLAWLKEMEQRGDVDWRQVKELHDSFSYSSSGLSGPAAMVIAIVVAYFTAGAASGMVGSAAGATAGSGTAMAAGTAAASAGWANVAVTSALTGLASNTAIGTINNKGNLGAGLKDATTSDALKGYAVSGITAGLTAGVYDNWTSTQTGASNTGVASGNTGILANSGKVAVEGGLSTWSGVGQFAANQALQNVTSATLNKVLGQDGDFGDALTSTLANTFAAAGFNWVGDFSQNNQLDNGSLAKIGLHAIMGGLAAEAAGGDFKSGALVAGANEALIDSLASQYDSMSHEQRSGLLTMNSQVLGVLVASMAGGDEKDMQTGAWLAGNATQYNYLTHNKLKEIQECLGGTSCNSLEQKETMLREAEDLSKMLDQEMTSICSVSPSSDACRTAVHSAIQYIAMTEAWELMNADVSRSSQAVFDQLYNSQDAEKWFSLHLNSIDKRADFFGASDRYEQNSGSGAQWFGGAEFVSRAWGTGLGADGEGSNYSFAAGSLLAGLDAPEIYKWRKVAGDTLLADGFVKFKGLYNNGTSDPAQWDINQLKSEQQVLQRVHEVYLLDKSWFRYVSEVATNKTSLVGQLFDDRKTIKGGVDILDYKSRVEYGCKLLGYDMLQGCAP